jgi:hypothetical protein
MIKTDYLPISAVFIATAVSLGFVLSGIPNLELMTVTIFLGGYVLGKFYGSFIGLFSAVLWSSLNPWGSGLAYPSLFASQILGFSVTGFSGGVVRLFINPLKIGLKVMIVFGLSGFILTLFYDIITNLGSIFLSGFNYNMIRNILIAGIPLSFFHIILNTFLFFTVLPTLIRKLARNGFLDKYINNNKMKYVKE